MKEENEEDVRKEEEEKGGCETVIVVDRDRCRCEQKWFRGHDSQLVKLVSWI